MYQSKGLSEIVRNPSPITIKYLNVWFTGNGSFGKALDKLKWPLFKDDSPLLVLTKKGLQTDLRVEEKVMYSRTLLHYVKKGNGFVLKIDFRKIINPNCLVGTIKSILSQSKLLTNYQNTYNWAKNLVETIPETFSTDKKEIEKIIADDVWPNVIAVDYIGEFIYSVLTNKLNEVEKGKLVNSLQKRISPYDWYTKAILLWNDVSEGKIAKDKFIKNYGFASDDDYELTKPRFYEILNGSKPKIEKIKILDMKINSLEDLYVGMQYLRSEAKHKSLIWISALRDAIYKLSG